MGRFLTALLLCFQLTTSGVAQQPATTQLPPPSQPQKPGEQKPNQQNPGQSSRTQSDDDLDVVKITTNLVQIDAVVTDQKGKRITDLRTDEVEMLENGKSQKITNFSYITLQPKEAEATAEKTKSVDRNAPLPPVKILLSGIVMKGMSLETYLKGTGTSAGNDKPAEIETEVMPNASAAVRQFRAGMALSYAFTIYNAQLDKASGKPKLKLQARLFRNGEQLFAGKELSYETAGQTDLKRLVAAGGIQLGTMMTPGEYVLQVVVTDMAKDKPRVTSQWLDFEMMK